jgi:hypothetical protein
MSSRSWRSPEERHSAARHGFGLGGRSPSPSQGWQSVPRGVKPIYLKDHGNEVINSALTHEDITEASASPKWSSTSTSRRSSKDRAEAGQSQ